MRSALFYIARHGGVHWQAVKAASAWAVGKRRRFPAALLRRAGIDGDLIGRLRQCRLVVQA